MISLHLKLMQLLFCRVFRSHGNRGPRFMNYQCSDDLKGGVVFYLGIDSQRNPAPFITSHYELNSVSYSRFNNIGSLLSVQK